MTSDSEDIEKIINARQAYADGVPTREIRATFGFSNGKLYQLLNGAIPEALGLPPIPLRAPERARPRPRLGLSRKELIKRIWRTASAQVRDIERRVVTATQQPDERERDARALAVMVKTLRELALLDARAANAAREAPTEKPADDEPADIDEFRRELARRIHAFVEARTGAGVSGGTAGGGD
jgi:hypothetical protein